ncbi:C-C chemokine receptor type 4 [Sceloporus undulatus]|uniref:C-C chemokine receptor type 4 n=1 Tax=Sceloporus undulatus TaxID=8520 RepID=UPI001C4B5816|nr:C-C chemokine receptor type 4 [Sceloporus undulatus]
MTFTSGAAPTTMGYQLYSLYEDNYDDSPEPCIKDEVRRFSSWFLPTFYSLVFLLGLAGNTLVLLVLFKYKRLRTMTDIYLFNLALSDLLFVFALPFWSYFVADEWVFGDGLCKVISWIYRIGFYSGIFFIMLMSIDRYLAVVHVVFALKARTVSYGTLASLIVWLVAIAASFPELIFSKSVSKYNHTACKSIYHSTEWKLFVSLETNILGLLMPFIVMLFCYTQIVKNLMHCRNEKKKKAVKMIFAVMIVFFVFWIPYNILLLLQYFVDVGIISGCSISKNLDYADQVTQTLAFFHCCLNPVIYFFMGQKFKKYIKLFFKNCILTKRLCKPCGLPETIYSESSSSFRTQSTSEEEAL